MQTSRKLYKGNHEPIISKYLFDEVQKSNKDKVKPQPLKRFFLIEVLWYVPNVVAKLQQTDKRNGTIIIAQTVKEVVVNQNHT